MPTEVASVAAIRLPVPRTRLRMLVATRCSMPVTSMTAPNIMAIMMSHTVESMLAMPPRDSRSSSAALPDSSLKPSKSEIQAPLARPAHAGRSGDAA